MYFVVVYILVHLLIIVLTLRSSADGVLINAFDIIRECCILV